MHRIERLGLGAVESDALDGDDGEAGIQGGVDDLAGEATVEGIGFDQGQGSR